MFFADLPHPLRTSWVGCYPLPRSCPDCSGSAPNLRSKRACRCEPCRHRPRRGRGGKGVAGGFFRPAQGMIGQPTEPESNDESDSQASRKAGQQGNRTQEHLTERGSTQNTIKDKQCSHGGASLLFKHVHTPAVETRKLGLVVQTTFAQPWP